MSKNKLQLVPSTRQISDLSLQEEARVLKLADIALHNPMNPQGPRLPGTRAKEDHRKLMEELQREAEKIRLPKRAA